MLDSIAHRYEYECLSVSFWPGTCHLCLSTNLNFCSIDSSLLWPWKNEQERINKSLSLCFYAKNTSSQRNLRFDCQIVEAWSVDGQKQTSYSILDSNQFV